MILDSTHKTAKPVEAAADALRKSIPLRMLVTLAVRPTVYESTLSDSAEAFATVVIAELRRLGMINIEGIQAIKAEEAGKGK